MVMVRDNAARAAQQQQRQAAAAEQQRREQEERDAAPKVQVRLSATYQETVKPAVPGVSPAEFRSIPPGEPVLVTHDERQRLRKLGLLVETAGETSRTGTAGAGGLTDEVYERAAQDVVAGETDLDYAVKGIARHFQAEPDTVRAELTRRVDERKDAVAAAQGQKSASEWAALPDEERTRLVDAELARLRTDRAKQK